MYTGTLIPDLLALAEKILNKACEPDDVSLPHAEFLEKVNIKRGLIDACRIVREEAADLREKQSAEAPTCRNCGGKLFFTQGRAYCGWVHADGHHTCDGIRNTAEPETDGERTIREGLSQWQQGQVGCFDS